MHDVVGKKKKDQQDANLAAAGLNPAYAGAYGAAPPVRPSSNISFILFLLIDVYWTQLSFSSFFFCMLHHLI